MKALRFLTLDELLLIQEHQIERFGGSHGLRDRALLESAAAQPQATFAGEFVHEEPFAMAAAYLFHLTSNHPFVDGNKRIGLAAALVFLDLNGYPITAHTEQLYELTMAVARGEVGKAELAVALRNMAGS